MKNRPRPTSWPPLVATILVAVSALILAPAAAAEPIQYTINFTAGFGIAPTSGSFAYDASTGTISAFTVDWMGATLTAPTLYSNLTGCTGEAAGGDPYEFSILAMQLSGCSDPPITYGWFIITPPTPAVEFYAINVDEEVTLRGNGSEIFTPGNTGTWEITAVPEPRSLALTMLGIGWLTRKRTWPAIRKALRTNR